MNNIVADTTCVFQRNGEKLSPHAEVPSKPGWAQLVFIGAPVAEGAQIPGSDSVSKAYSRMRKGGSIVVFVDIWTLSDAARTLQDQKFKQLRYVQLIRESDTEAFYPSDNRIMAIVAVKQGGSTFNDHYHNGAFDQRDSEDYLISELVALHTDHRRPDLIVTEHPDVAKMLENMSVDLREQTPPTEEQVEKWKAKVRAYKES